MLCHFWIISVWAWTEKKCGNESNEKETKHIYASAANLLHISIGNINWSNEDVAKAKQKERAVCNAFYFGENPSAQGKHFAIQFL